jgi:hypothetical protein
MRDMEFKLSQFSLKFKAARLGSRGSRLWFARWLIVLQRNEGRTKTLSKDSIHLVCPPFHCIRLIQWGRRKEPMRISRVVQPVFASSFKSPKAWSVSQRNKVARSRKFAWDQERTTLGGRTCNVVDGNSWCKLLSLREFVSFRGGGSKALRGEIDSGWRERGWCEQQNGFENGICASSQRLLCSIAVEPEPSTYVWQESRGRKQKPSSHSDCHAPPISKLRRLLFNSSRWTQQRVERVRVDIVDRGRCDLEHQ